MVEFGPDQYGTWDKPEEMPTPEQFKAGWPAVAEARNQRNAEIAAANAAVKAALSSYRWWGWTNICNTFRMACTRVRIWFNMRLWP